MPFFERILDEVCRAAEREKVEKGKIPYWLECPGCGKRVVRKELLSKGCYVCGWHEARDEAKLAKIGRDGQVRNNAGQTATPYMELLPSGRMAVLPPGV